MTNKPTPEVSHCVRTLRLKVMGESYAWLNAAAAEVNQVWNWANATAFKAVRPFAGPGKYLSAYDLDKLSAGAAAEFDYLGSEMPAGGCSRRSCSTRASRPAGAYRSSTSETRREHAAAVGPERDPQAWTCLL
jgi:hypothetical protein